MSKSRDTEPMDLEPEVTSEMQPESSWPEPSGKIDWRDPMTPHGPSPRVAEDASEELGEIGPDDPAASDLPFDITPDGLEQRGPVEDEERETARPTPHETFVHEDDWPPGR